ncbi:hypothetical protein OHA40_31220 [Nocardia sp. NBC_00508]|nr:hypothetical protein [Nocardia sp. NBC_00508]WUD65999.1 hypothetical protein OHA40_31220 [Nocardia sp. NBC_00508]
MPDTARGIERFQQGRCRVTGAGIAHLPTLGGGPLPGASVGG